MAAMPAFPRMQDEKPAIYLYISVLGKEGFRP